MLTEVESKNYIMIIGEVVELFFIYIIILSQSNSFTVLLFSLLKWCK
jgi:hypothetical protein